MFFAQPCAKNRMDGNKHAKLKIQSYCIHILTTFATALLNTLTSVLVFQLFPQAVLVSFRYSNYTRYWELFVCCVYCYNLCSEWSSCSGTVCVNLLFKSM